MDLTKPFDLKRLLNAHGLQLSKRFGQNFLVDRSHLLRVVNAAEITPADNIFEIGPGVGTLTVELAQRAKRVVCVEFDRAVLPALAQTVAPFPNVTIVQADALKLELAEFLLEHFGGEPAKVVANIPYNITSPLLIQMLPNRRFTSLTLMVQKEVVDRLIAAPDTENYGSLSVFAQFYAQVSTFGVVPRGAFYPPPRVDSAVVHLAVRNAPPVNVPSEAAFFAVSRAAFNQRRKTLLNALANAPTLSFSKTEIAGALAACGIDGVRRGETLSLAEIAALSFALPFDAAFDKAESGGV